MDTTNTDIHFDNLTILKEFSNIVNLVKVEEFLEIVPKTKLQRVKWVPVFNYLQQGIADEMIQEMSSMWQYENMPEKLKILEKQKEKFTEITTDVKVWRPQLGDVKAQLKARDVATLQKQKKFLESIVKEYEIRVTRLQKSITAKRGYLKVLQMDIQKYQKKNEDFISRINDKLEKHNDIVDVIEPITVEINQTNWPEKDLDIEMEIDNA